MSNSCVMSVEELACAYGAAILADDDIAVTSDKLNTILKAANIQVEPIWPMLYARALGDVSVRDVITDLSARRSAPPAGPSGPGNADDATKNDNEVKVNDGDNADDTDDSCDEFGINLFGD